jgi:hypothetical protein
MSQQTTARNLTSKKRGEIRLSLFKCLSSAANFLTARAKRSTKNEFSPMFVNNTEELTTKHESSQGKIVKIHY